MILILTEEVDPHADQVIEVLRQRGAEWVRFNPGKFPARAEIAVACEATGPVRRRLWMEGETLDLDRVTAVWYRRPRPPESHEAITDERVREYVAEECRFTLNDLWHTLDCRWVPAPPSVIRRAECKAAQLQLAGALGFELPPTLLTNNPEAFLDFYRRHNGEVISKLAGPAFIRSFGEQFVRYTEVVSRRDLGYADSVRYCPVLFQAYVPKKMELRVTVVGEQVFAAEIHSQESNHTRHDWRRYDWYQTRYLPHDLPREVKRRCLQLVERLGLCFGAIDLIQTPDGRYVFLEINPNGQYLWIEQQTGLPISEAVGEVLMAGARGRERGSGDAARRVGVGVGVGVGADPLTPAPTPTRQSIPIDEQAGGGQG
jgi:glutathione synthase/RimK-type ligase-like ATP-grasp enzyme